MGTKWCIWIVMLVFAASGATAQESAPGEAFLGTWSGKWAGGEGAGGLALTRERGDGGQLGGRVAITGDPSYDVNLKSVSFNGPKMAAKYDLPADEGAEVLLEATFDGNTANGTWSLRVKENDSELVNGTWSAKRR